MLLDQLRIESTLPVPGDRQIQPTIVGEHPFAAVAVAVVAAGLLLLVVEMMIQFRVENALRQRLLQVLDQIASLKCLKRVRSIQ